MMNLTEATAASFCSNCFLTSHLNPVRHFKVGKLYGVQKSVGRSVIYVLAVATSCRVFCMLLITFSRKSLYFTFFVFQCCASGNTGGAEGGI